MTALRYLAKAFGGVSRLVEQAELNATTLYRTLSPLADSSTHTCVGSFIETSSRRTSF
jgi:DNA-binding phage protein